MERLSDRAWGTGTLSAVRPSKLLLLGVICLGLLMAAPAAMAATVDFRYWGGPVANSMNVHLVEWGPGVKSEYTDPNSGDPAFFNYLASQSGTTTDIGGVLAQYMDTAGVNAQNQLSYGGLDEIAPPSSGGVSGCPLPTCVDDRIIQSALRSEITSNVLPAPAGNGLQTMYVVLFPPGTNVCQNGTCAFTQSNGFCAYHGSFQLPGSGTHVLYAPIVDDGSGTPNAGECGEGTGDVANQTEVISHELAETITDPLAAEATSNGPPLAWYDTNQSDPNGGGEIGDICVSPTADAPNGSWTVQKVWSNRDANCVASESAYSAPQASFLATNTASPGAPLSFDASASTDPTGNSASAMYASTTYSIGSGLASYRWNWGDGNPSAASSSPTATHTYASPGNYQVSLTVTDNLGFTSTLTHEVAIAGSPAAPAAPAATTPTPAPSVDTGVASDITSSGATVAGSVNPNGVATTYQVQFGPTTSYGYSSAPVSAGSGTSSRAVSVGLNGLKPGTTYHYRFVASDSGGTAVGADRTFTTSPALAPAPKLSFRVLGHPALPGVLARGLRMRFTCDQACVARFSVVVVPANGVLRVGSVPLSIASGTAHLHGRGSATAVLKFSGKVRRRLAGAKLLRLNISGVAGASGTASSAPVLRRLTVHRRPSTQTRHP